jgi:septum formation protein
MSKPLREVTLASVSPRRRQLLESLGLTVVVVKSDFQEPPYRPDMGDPKTYAQRAAEEKARRANAGGPPVLVAADTVVVVDESVLGKPASSDEAAAMLRRLSGRTHHVHSGFAVIDRATGRSECGVESADVTFAPLDDERITRYVMSGEPMDKAGAYGIQGLGALLVASIAGDFYTVMGLPLARVGQALTHLGYQLF